MNGSIPFGIKAWAAWSPALTTSEEWLVWADSPFMPTGDEKPKVAGMQPMNRRRLKRLGSMALETAYKLPETNAPIIFCSKLGESDRCYELLKELTETGALSPQSFSLAVHNAIPSLYTIDKKMHSNVLAISSEAGIFSALIEAQGLFACGAEMVRIIIAEEGVPNEYRQYCSFAEESFAYALDLIPEGDLTVSFSAADGLTQEVSLLSPNLNALRFFLTKDAMCKSTIGKTVWQLNRGGV